MLVYASLSVPHSVHALYKLPNNALDLFLENTPFLKLFFHRINYKLQEKCTDKILKRG